jgi:hypothetical protein
MWAADEVRREFSAVVASRILCHHLAPSFYDLLNAYATPQIYLGKAIG